MTAAAETQERTELDRVEAWRQEELERAGYGVAGAQELAQRHDIDLHSAVALLRRGCPQEVALQILL
jgi:hypothetical protein